MAENLGNATLYLGTDDARMKKGLKDAERSTSRAFGAMRTLAVGAGVAAAGAIAAIGVSAFNVSKDTEKATKKIQAQLRTTEKEAKRLGKAAKAVFKNNFADSIEESGEAVMLLSEQLGDAARGQEQTLAELAFGLRDAFGPEVDKVIAAVSTLTQEFDDLDAEQAFDFIATGFQKGLDKSGDFLDSIGEYSNLFSDAEFSAAEFFSTMETGQAGGVLGTDKIADAMKEFQIRLIEGSDAVSEALTDVGLNADEIFAGLSDGTLSVKDVWDQLLPAINAIEDPLERNRALIELLGTQAEDLGTNFTEGIDSGKTSLEEMEGASESLNEQYKTLTDGIAGLWRNVIVEVSPLTDLLVSMGGTHLPKISAWVTNTLPGVVTAMTGFLTDPANTIKNMFALPDATQFLIKLKFRWAIIKNDFGAWLTTASQRITDFLESPDTAAFLIKLKFKWLIIQRDFKSWLTSAAQRITDFFAAPLSDPLVQALQSTWTTVKDTFQTWVVDHLIADYVQLPDDVTWATAIQAVWESVQSGFQTWVVDHLIADYVQLPESATWGQTLKAVWQSVRTAFQSWLTSAGETIRDYFDIPDAATFLQVLQAIWSNVRTAFQSWLTTAGETISDYFNLPDAATLLSVLQAIWSNVRSQFQSWLTSAGETIRDYFDIPDAATFLQVLQAIWSNVRTAFQSWLTTAGETISDYFNLPDDVSFLAALKIIWNGVKTDFEVWASDPKNILAVQFGFTPKPPDEEETKNIFVQFRDTILSVIDLVFGDIDFFRAIGFGVEVDGKSLGPLRRALESITSFLASIETAVETADRKIDEFFEKFNADIIDEWARGIGTTIAYAFNSFVGFLSNSMGELGANLSVSGKATGISMQRIFDGAIGWMRNMFGGMTAWINTAFNAFLSWTTQTAVALGAWLLGLGQGISGWLTSVFETFNQSVTGLYAGFVAWIQGVHQEFSSWLTSGALVLGISIWSIGQGISGWLKDVWNGFVGFVENGFNSFIGWLDTAAKHVVDVINSLIRLMNAPLRAWNAIEFSLPSKSWTIGFGPFEAFGKQFGGLSKTFAFGGAQFGTPNIPMISAIGYGGGGGGADQGNIVMMASGGLAMGPTMAMIGEREPEAVLRMDQLRDFAGVGQGGGKAELHIHVENAYGVDDLVDKINEAWLDGRLRGLQDQLAGVG